MTTWLITGCSTGLGRALAQAVLARGDNAVVTARDVSKLQDLATEFPTTALAVALDVTEQSQIEAAMKEAEERFGAVDVLVNNAGYGYRAAIEEGDDGDVRALFDTNVFGPVAMIKAVLPAMRSRRSGAIVNISSIGARICPPGSGYYSATKTALEGPVRLVAEGTEASGNLRDSGGARCIPDGFCGAFADAICPGDPGLRRDGREASQGK
ncbi:SDR family NAD(P)-dependent oxidoreductase [Arthrobacter sp. StoSoilB13]|uniref:SDR family NAD(P)-dependent oxidoreductase n=1 Tax=Arthrobacter sp. StoSoilB13 TaxID=2830993 RepID=UPI001E7BB339|nr:hypothetical protein StoSoilB13_22650 [Arthrobacter sp. StoSoilB13]